jgi:hypothetical protein
MNVRKLRSLILASLPLFASLPSSLIYHSRHSQLLVTTPRMHGLNLVADGTAPVPPRPSKQALNLIADGTAPVPPRPSKQALNLIADGTAPVPPRPSQALNADFVTA